jgi:type IV pilus assembly protein PilO
MAKSFHELSPRAQLIIFGLLCALTVAGAWQVLISPLRIELETQNARMAKVEADVARVQAMANKLPQYQREVRALEVALRETMAVIPDERDPQDVLRNLHELASESTLDLATFTPKPVVAKTQYSEWPLQLGIEGTYHDLGRFFARVAAMARLMSVSDMTIKTPTRPGAKGTIAVQCLATTFVFKKDIESSMTTTAATTPQPTTPGGRQ